MAQRPSSVLITGGAGFIGSTLVRQWLEGEPETIVDLDKLTYAGLRESLAEVLENPRHTLVEGDVADAPLVRSLLAEYDPAVVVHLAAETHVDRSIDGPPAFAETNMAGACTLLDEATRHWHGSSSERRKAFRFVYISTDEVFGSAAPGESFSDDSALAPNSPYAASKAGAEHLVRAFAHTFGLPTVVVNPTNNYGPRQLPEKLIPKMILAAARREPLPLYGDGQHQRDWLHVEDCCRAIRAVVRRGAPGRRYRVGADRRRSNLQVVEQICDLLDARLMDGGNRRELIRHVEDRPGHDRRYAVDAGPLRRELGWRPVIDFASGLESTVDWYLRNPAWVAAAELSLRTRDAAEKAVTATRR
jgi:dTDP-glucose 4,6-dehydratase